MMSRSRRRLLVIIFSLALLSSCTAISQISAHFGHQGDTIACRPLSIITREDYLADGSSHTLPALENGDILLTFSTHSFGWRHGHAGLVVDAERGLTLEAVLVGRPSAVISMEHWRYYSTLYVFRLKDADPEVRQAVAEFAMNTLNEIPYRLTSGLYGAPAEDAVTAQCSYLVWYAYAHFGYDLDSDGGRLVTVADLAASPLLEIVPQNKD